MAVASIALVRDEHVQRRSAAGVDGDGRVSTDGSIRRESGTSSPACLAGPGRDGPKTRNSADAFSRVENGQQRAGVSSDDAQRGGSAAVFSSRTSTLLRSGVRPHGEVGAGRDPEVRLTVKPLRYGRAAGAWLGLDRPPSAKASRTGGDCDRASATWLKRVGDLVSARVVGCVHLAICSRVECRAGSSMVKHA